MKKNGLVLTVYSRTYRAANDDGPGIHVQRSTQSKLSEVETSLRSGWDPFEVWRTRILNPAKQRSHEH
ncbi:MAG: hypothetical protein ACRETB_09520 [Steroidobacteraceae bacterium]